MRAGFKTIELWAGSPHFFLSNLEYDDCKKVSKMARERGLTIQVITPENCSVPYQLQPETRICMPKVNISKKAWMPVKNLAVRSWLYTPDGDI